MTCPKCGGTLHPVDDVAVCDKCSYSEPNLLSTVLPEKIVFTSTPTSIGGNKFVTRRGKEQMLVSSVHHQRHAPCGVLVQCTKDEERIPFRVTVTPVDSRWIPRRDIMPFDCFIDLGLEPYIENDRDREMFKQALQYDTFLEVFINWFEKCNLGYSAVGEPRKFLPLFLTFEQYEKAREIWSHGTMDEWATHPYRVLESVIAFNNDWIDMQGEQVKCGKNTYMQFAAKYGHEIPRDARGPLRLDCVLRAYNQLLNVRV